MYVCVCVCTYVRMYTILITELYYMVNLSDCRSSPKDSWTIPAPMMRTRASSLAYVKISCTRVDSFTSNALMAVKRAV